MTPRPPRLFRWLERVAVLVVLLLVAGVILACWMPAMVGPTPREPGARGEFRGRPPR